ncbi:MAG TPA: ATPase, T2SS/T4P/T4SS family [Thermoguttaceae bacterium]|nr:ATPase, T2SS/T4P/T4SS family [Thermoguttaceae bacterium]
MLRTLFLLFAVALIVLVVTGESLAADSGEWPAFKDPDPRPESDFRGPGFYVSWVKILACWLVFLVWVYSTDWVNRDAQELKLEFLRWNPIVFGTFVGAFVLVWLLPSFWIAFPLLLIAYAAPLGSYVVYRNSRVTNDQRVFTREHIRYCLSVWFGKVGVKIEAEAPDPHSAGPPVVLGARGADDPKQNAARLLAARQTPGILPAREILADALSYRSSAIMLDYSQQGAAVRCMVDGVWLNREAIERERGDPALETLKVLCGLNPKDRQNRQSGTFQTEYRSLTYPSTLTSQGTKTGERVLVQLMDEKVRFETFDDIGLRTKLREQIQEMLDMERGLLLISAMPAGGLRSTADVVLRHTDRLMREFIAVEEETNRYQEVENCPVTTYNAAGGQSPADVLPKVFRTQPDVVVVRDLVNAETVRLMCRETAGKRQFISTVRAKDCADALMRVLAMGVPAAELAGAVAAVVGQRLIRKLCDACKEAYAPPPQILNQLGIPEGRVQAFYRPPQPTEETEVCEKCSGIGYYGRTAIFELLTVGNTVRQVLRTGPKPDLLRKAGRKDGMRSLQEEGVLLVAKGITSLPELMRVLKQ